MKDGRCDRVSSAHVNEILDVLSLLRRLGFLEIAESLDKLEVSSCILNRDWLVLPYYFAIVEPERTDSSGS